MNAYRLVYGSAVATLLWLDAILFHGRTVAIVGAIFSTVATLTYLAVGAVRAERARRYGCW